MACETQILNGIGRDCEINSGGLKEVYIANFDDVASITVDESEGRINAISMVSSTKFKRYVFKKGQATLEVTPQFNGLSEYAGEQPKLTLNFGRMETAKRMEIQKLSVGEFAIIVLDNNGVYWYLGKDRGMMRTGGNSTFGANRTDTNQYSIEFTGDDFALPYEVTAEAVANVVDA